MDFERASALLLATLHVAAGCGEVATPGPASASGAAGNGGASVTGTTASGGGGGGSGGSNEGGGGEGRGGGPPHGDCGDTSGLASAPWAMDAFCPTRHGRSPFAGPTSATTLQPIAANDATGIAIGSDGTLFVSSLDAAAGLRAIDPAGAVLWSVPGAVASTPALGANGLVYVGTTEGEVRAIDGGTVVWSFATTSTWLTSPVVAGDGTIYVGSLDGALYAITPAGEERWHASLGVDSSAPAIGFDGTVYAGSSTGLHAIDPMGVELWTVAGNSAARAPSIASDGTVYVVADGYLDALSADGALLWSHLAPDGSMLWKLTLPNEPLMPVTAPIGADGRLYVRSPTGVVAVGG